MNSTILNGQYPQSRWCVDCNVSLLLARGLYGPMERAVFDQEGSIHNCIHFQNVEAIEEVVRGQFQLCKQGYGVNCCSANFSVPLTCEEMLARAVLEESMAPMSYQV